MIRRWPSTSSARPSTAECLHYPSQEKFYYRNYNYEPYTKNRTEGSPFSQRMSGIVCGFWVTRVSS